MPDCTRERLRAIAYNCLVIFAVVLGAHELSIAFSPAVGIVYAFYVIFMLYYVLRKHLCTNCVYYGKICYTGWGVLAAKLFPKESGDFEVGKMRGLTWGIFLFLPFSAFIVLGDWWRMLLWVALTIFFMADHFGHCAKCPMRERCIKPKRVNGGR